MTHKDPIPPIVEKTIPDLSEKVSTDLKEIRFAILHPTVVRAVALEHPKFVSSHLGYK